MTKFKALGFDWGGVIYGQPSPTYNEAIAEVLGISVDEYKKVYSKHNSLVNIQSYSPEKFWPVILKEINKEDKYEAIMSYLKNRPTNYVNESMVRLISELKKKGYKLGILSNNTLENGVKIKQSEVANLFDTIVISAEVGYMKPDKKVFEVLATRLGVQVDEILFIDDTERAISLAKEIGYYPLIFSDYNKLVKDLKTLNV